MTPDPRIATLTPAPALDVSTTVPFLAPTHKLRCGPPVAEPGGGGINVSRVCARLGEPSAVVAPLGGVVGQEVLRLLGDAGQAVHPVPIEGATRQSVTVREDATGDQYRFVLPAPGLTPDEVDACRTAVVEAAASARTVVVSGSVPPGAQDLVTAVVEDCPHAAVLVDTSGPALEAALWSGAHLVKPSARELADVTGTPLDTEVEVACAARALVARSRVDVLVVSIGAGGALVVPSGSETIRVRAPTVKVRSAVGAGDAMVAGLAVGLARGWDLQRAATLGVAAGTAAVLTDGTELCHADDIDALLPLVVVDQV